MGGGLRGVASFSFNWDSVSMPVAIFLLPDDFCALLCAFTCAALDGAALLRRGCGFTGLVFRRDLVCAVGMRGHDVHDGSIGQPG